MPNFPPFTKLEVPGLIVHAGEGWRNDMAAGRFELFAKLEGKARAEGFAVGLVQAEQPASKR